MLFNVDNAGQISFVSKLEEDKKAETNSKFSAKHLFQTRDKMGVSDVADTILNTTHQNQVCAKFSGVIVKKKTSLTDVEGIKTLSFLHVYQYIHLHKDFILASIYVMANFLAVKYFCLIS